jgi:hypothetical protein
MVKKPDTNIAYTEGTMNYSWIDNKSQDRRAITEERGSNPMDSDA